MGKIKRYIMKFLYNERPELRFIKFPLILFSLPVIFFTTLKRFLYRHSFILKAKDTGIFTVSLGNVNLGGTGKTPFSYTIGEYFYGLSLKPCIVSRGYKGRLKKNSI